MTSAVSDSENEANEGDASVQPPTHDLDTTLPPDSPRKQFLRHMGFKWDVFAQPNAEQEYSFAERDDLRVLAPQVDDFPRVSPRAYYVDPLYDNTQHGSVFYTLRAPGHALVYGAPGAGKSTLRLAVEAHARAFPDETLVVTYEPGRAVEEEVAHAVAVTPASAVDAVAVAQDAHLRLLTAALAVDVFIQIVEQFYRRHETPTEAQNVALRRLMATGGPRLRRVLRRLIGGDDRPAGEEAGDERAFEDIAWLWRRLDRPVVQPVTLTAQLRAWLRALDRAAPGETVGDAAGATLWQEALDTARQWGFRRVFILLDGLDTYWRRPEDMLVLLDPLLRLMPGLAEQDVSLKCFLPEELQTDVAAALEQAGAAEVRIIRLDWTPARLLDLLLARYRAGHARLVGLSHLVAPELCADIDDRLLAAAQGSPRRLLLIMRELIDAHVARPPVEGLITTEEWATALARAEALMASSA